MWSEIKGYKVGSVRAACDRKELITKILIVGIALFVFVVCMVLANS
jgi:t-SNARE complex subunit (syntaxin)